MTARNCLVDIPRLEVAEGSVEIPPGAGRGVLGHLERVCLAGAEGEKLADRRLRLPGILDRVGGMAATSSLHRFPGGDPLWLEPLVKGLGSVASGEQPQLFPTTSNRFKP